MCSLDVVGDEDKFPTIGCDVVDSPDSSLIVTVGTAMPGCRLSFRNLRFTNINVTLIGASVEFFDVTFVNSTILIQTGGASSSSALFERVSMTGHSKCTGGSEACSASSYFGVSGAYSNVTVTESTFMQASVKMDLSVDTEIHVCNTTFDNDIFLDHAVIGGLLVGLWPLTTNSTVHVDQTIFRNQFNWSPVDAVMNIFESALRVYLFRAALGLDILRKTLNPYVVYNVSVEIYRSDFINNERGVTIQGSVPYVIIEDSQFLTNIAMHAGAGILLLTNKDLSIRGCNFVGNSAGNPRYTDVLPRKDLVVISGDEARVHSMCCKGAVTLSGKGGAIRVQLGNTLIENSTFTNNSARISGGTIFVDRGSKLRIQTSEFSNADDRRFASQQGEIIYSNGHVIVDGGIFTIYSATSHTSLFQHSGDRWSIEVYDISFKCPMGFRIRVTNTTSYRVVDTQGLKRSYKLDQLSYFCESCARYKYSIDYGYMSYSLKYGVLDYFALMINEQYPDESKEEQYYLHDITCKSCPYGATCENRIQALPNFWGYQSGKNLEFQMCPKGYCCSNPRECVNHDTCASHRAGRLCGICEYGYSEAMFSPKCVPDYTCGPIWIWPFAFSTGIIYFLVLLFQKDIREFIFSGDINRGLSNLMHCKTQDSPETASDGENLSMMKLEVLAVHVDVTSGEEDIHINGNHSVDKGSPDKQVNGEVTVIASAKNSTTDISEATTLPGDDEHGYAKSSDEISEKDEDILPPSPPKTDIGAIMLIMVMYYFQDAMLFHIKAVTYQPEARVWSQVKTVLLGLFKFRLEVAHFVDNVCILPGLTASQKLLAKTLMVPFVLLNFVVVYSVYMCVQCVRNSRCCGKLPREQAQDTFTTRMATGFMLALLFMYQLLATTAFKLLNCVMVGEESVLFLEGTVTCYQTWQHGVVAYAICCTIPFCFVLMIGPGMLKDKRISVCLFFVACICPLPFVSYWLGRRMRQKCLERVNRKVKASDSDLELVPTEAESAVLKVMQGPFRDIESRYIGPMCWAGVLIFRRLVLVLFYTFINNVLIRIICMLCFCFVILLVHVHVRPYRDPRVNIAGSVSISALMVVGGINLIRASFEVAEYIPQGPNEMLIWVMKESENVLMLWVPLVTMTLILLALVSKILYGIWKICTCQS